MYKQVSRLAVFLGLAVAILPVCAQSVNSVRVYTVPAGLQFTIDGQTFVGSTDYLWPATSKHVILGFDQFGVDLNTQFTYLGWTTNLGSGGTNQLQPITADPNLKWVRLDFTAAYLLTVKIFNCSAFPDGACPSPGKVILNPSPSGCPAVITIDCSGWLPAGSPVQAQAFPNSGYIFTGWGPLTGQPQPVSTTAFQISFTMTGAEQLSPIFWPAQPVQVTLQTQPPNLQVFADRTPYGAPVNLEWGWGTTHAVGTLPSQSYLGKPYVFDSWSDGGAINHDYQMQSGYTQVAITAKFLPAATVSFLTTPPGLTLGIDGRQNWPSYNFQWGAGSSHAVSAPVTQTDAQGRKYQFVAWSNGQPASFSYQMSDPPADDTLTAKYQALGTITLASAPSGILLQVDSATCTTPCTLERPYGSVLKVSAPAMIQTAPNSRLLFQGWKDSGDGTRQFTVSGNAQTYTLSYQQQNLLVLSATPADGASISVTPASTDGFYNAGALVSISAQPALGFRFAGWTGDLSGSALAAALTLDAPKSAGLLVDRVPAIAPGGASNAASSAAVGVTPGSLISVFGANLAPALQVGTGNPLPQMLQNVTVRADDAFLPLIFVSPGQINGQLPSATSLGTHTIVVHWEGKPETSTQVLVARNAPGLFGAGAPDQPVGSFVRSSGLPVTADNPAQAGEIVSVLGTGLGPYVLQPPDGFLFDETAGYTLQDSVTVVAGDQAIDALYAGRSGAAVGVDTIRFQVPVTLPDSPFLPVKIRINGQESNTVFLPITR